MSAEVERLRVAGRNAYTAALDRHEPHPWVDMARAVLEDLEARYVLVPREGVTVRTDWGIRMPTTGRVFTEPREPGPDLLERGQVKVSRTHIIGPWEAQP